MRSVTGSRVIANAITSALLICFAACGASRYSIERTLGGYTYEGDFVSPHQYEWFVRGELAAARGDFLAAATAYEMARAGSRTDALITARLAEAWDRVDRTADALALIAQGLERDPSAEALWLARGRIMERQGRISETQLAFARATEAAPQSARGPLALFELLRSEGAEAEAEAVLQRFLARARTETVDVLTARFRLAVARGDAWTTLAALRELLAVVPARIAAAVEAAEEALESDQPWVAAAIADALPDDEHPLLRARAYIAAFRFEDAEAVLAGMPVGDGDSLTAQAMLFLEMGRIERAQELAEAALELHPGEPRGRLILGRAQLASGQAVEGVETLLSIPEGSRAYDQARDALREAAERLLY